MKSGKYFDETETDLKIGDVYKANGLNLKVKVSSFGKHKRYEEEENRFFLEALNTIADFKKGEIFPYYSEERFLKAYEKVNSNK